MKKETNINNQSTKPLEPNNFTQHPERHTSEPRTDLQKVVKLERLDL